MATGVLERVARNDLSVKIDADVVKQAKIVATHRGMTVAEYLSELCRSLVTRDYRESLREMADEFGEPPAGRPPQPPKKGGPKP